MSDFYEIMDFCGFDLAKAHKMATEINSDDWVDEALKEIGLEKISAESVP